MTATLTFLMLFQSSFNVFAQDSYVEFKSEYYEIFVIIDAAELLAEAGLVDQRTIAHTINFTSTHPFSVTCQLGCDGRAHGHAVLSGNVTFNANGTLTPHGIPEFRATWQIDGPENTNRNWTGTANLFDNRFNMLNNNMAVEARGTVHIIGTAFVGLMPHHNCRFPTIHVSHIIR